MELCIDLGGTRVKIGMVEAHRVIAHRSFAVTGTGDDLTRAAAEAERLRSEVGARTSAVGIGLPGVVDSSGRLLHANDKYAFLENLPIRDWACSQFGLPAIVENDARAALVGETANGAAAGPTSAVIVTLGTGIGTAAIVDGSLLRGSHGHAGILGGHVTVDLDGPVCACGNLGCGEALASTWALRNDDTVPVDDIESLVRHAAGDRTLQDGLDRYLRTWGATVVTLCHMYDPEIVVLSGGVLEAGSVVASVIESYVHRHLWPSVDRPRFAVPSEPSLPTVRGLAVLAARAASQSDGDTEGIHE